MAPEDATLQLLELKETNTQVTNLLAQAAFEIEQVSNALYQHHDQALRNRCKDLDYALEHIEQALDLLFGYTNTASDASTPANQ
jgi:hypothetical protein